MTRPEPERYDWPECDALFERLFPHRLGGEDVLVGLAPDGWEQSPLVCVFHPSLDQVYQERLCTHRQLKSLSAGKEGHSPQPEPTLEEVRDAYEPLPVDARREAAELVARCLWHVFSDNNAVVGPDGRRVDIGTFRGAAGFLADLLNQAIGEDACDYIMLYMGTIWIYERADLTPVYELIFTRLMAGGLDWIYRPHDMETDAVEPGQRDRRDTASSAEAEPDKEAAVEHAVPTTIAAYHRVYGRAPTGWPWPCS